MPFHTLNPNLILGYHGCDHDIGERILAGEDFKFSENDYDWLGRGIYFWESNPNRALSFATEQKGRGKIKDPFVVGAVLSLGKCIDTLSEKSLDALLNAHKFLVEATSLSGEELPQNRGGDDLLFRDLDCAVVTTLHKILDSDGQKIDSVRALYHEGTRLYDNAGFYSKSHVQIAICNPECIKGVFRVNHISK